MGNKLIYILIVLLFFSLTIDNYTLLVIALSVILLWRVISKFGKGVVLMEIIGFYGCILYLLMPLLGYKIYTRTNTVAVLWGKYMPLPENDYFSFVLPAFIAFLIAIVGFQQKNPIDEGDSLRSIVQGIKKKLAGNASPGIVLIVVGLAAYLVKDKLPGPLSFVGTLLYLSLFAGLLYIHFQPGYKKKHLWYGGIGVFLVADALRTGMFTTVVYMGLTLSSILLMDRRISLPTKLLTVSAGIMLIFMLQLVKGAYRKGTWSRNFSGSYVEMFQDVVTERSSDFGSLFSPNTFFPIYVRLNQGFNTALVIKRIPVQQPFDGGTSIFNSVAASVIPRVVWPDKPEAGGAYNMQHFTGIKLVNWSTNIGPIGEAYGNFGPVGGIFYMFLVGCFIRYTYKTLFVLSRKDPILLLWLPVLFYEVTFFLENDTLQALNSIMKASIFLVFLYKAFPKLFLNKVHPAY